MSSVCNQVLVSVSLSCVSVSELRVRTSAGTYNKLGGWEREFIIEVTLRETQTIGSFTFIGKGGKKKVFLSFYSECTFFCVCLSVVALHTSSFNIGV